MKKQLLAMSMIAATGLMAQNGSPNSQTMYQDGCDDCCCNNPRPCIDSESYIPSFHNLQCDCGFFFDVEFLYWYARESNVPYATRLTAISNGSETSDPEVVAVPTGVGTLTESWDPGVRVGLGWNMACDGWDLSLFWTYYKNTSSQSLSSPEFQGDRASLLDEQSIRINLFTFLGDTTDRQFSSVKSKWTNRFNEIDLTLGKKVWWSHCFAIRPYAGLRGAWTRTRLDVTGTDGPKGELESFRLLDSQFKNRIWGVGVVGGFEPTFYFTDCFAIYANLGFSVQWGEYEEKDQGVYFVENTDGESLGVDRNFTNSLSFDYDLMTSILDTALGLRWERTWCDCRYRSNLDLGWEHHIWSPHSFRFREGYSNFVSDLGFGGLVVRVRFDF